MSRTQKTAFGDLTVAFDDRVLRPRPWTTAQSYWAADLLRDAPDGPVLELCAGVGHIGLLATVGTTRRLVLVDLNEAACELAKENARAARPAASVDVRHGRLDEVVGREERFVGIIADPPWVPSESTGRFPEDPLTAIDGGPDGMDIAWGCLDVASEHLTEQGWVLLQLGTVEQADAVHERLASAPERRLKMVEVREYGAHGVLVNVNRTS